jgi:ribosomal-protein-alanine N-acetyltransferase
LGCPGYAEARVEGTHTLTTERLIVRVPAVSDADAIATYQAANRRHLAVWEPLRPEEYYTAAFWRLELQRLSALSLQGATVPFILSLRDLPPHVPPSIVGTCSLTNIVRGPFQAAYLGFGLAEAAVGQGLMSEALSAVIHFAFTDLNLHRLMANHQPENDRSARLLARLGFTVEGRAPDYLHINGAWRDHVLMSLINGQWRAP